MPADAEQPALPEAVWIAVGEPGGFVAVGAGGWLYWHIPGCPPVRAQLADTPRGFSVRFLAVDGGDSFGITAGDLRKIQIGKLLNIVNGPSVRQAIDVVMCLDDSLELDIANVSSAEAFAATAELADRQEVPADYTI